MAGVFIGVARMSVRILKLSCCDDGVFVIDFSMDPSSSMKNAGLVLDR